MSQIRGELMNVSKNTEDQRLGVWPTNHGSYIKVWAPQAHQVEVILDEKKKSFNLDSMSKGYFGAFIPKLKHGDLYKLKLNKATSYPDPCSHYQPQGPHGPSMVINHSNYKWHDERWQKEGITLKNQVIYELHVGSFTQEGTFDALTKKLHELKNLGITLIEIMPVVECPGHWNWGYDGVNLFAPYHVYGTVDQFKKLIDSAHQIGMGIILDVVYNHFGPDGNYLESFSKDYFTSKYKTDWGKAINFDGKNSQEVREFFIQNALYWINEFHLDGLRLDATQNIYDKNSKHILAEITAILRQTAKPKKIILIAENESQEVRLINPLEKGGYGIDALWNDDFHHSAKVALTGHREAYYLDYLGRAQEFISCLKRGYLYQGQYYSWQKQNRGTLVHEGIDPESFINYIQNHDQIANSLTGRRIHQQTDPASYRTMTALLLLAPQTPMIFMGQEYAADNPFLFFVDHNQELSEKIFIGRREFLNQFASIASAIDQTRDPSDPKTFKDCKLNLDDAKKEKHKFIYQLHLDLLRLRKYDNVFNGEERISLDGAVLDHKAFVIRYFGQTSDRLLLINLGDDLNLFPCPEPLLAARTGKSWQFLWSSEHTAYGGLGIVKASSRKQWYLPGRSAQVFT